MGKVICGVTQGRRLRAMRAAAGTAYIVTYEPRQAMPDHTHERASLTLVLDGEFFDRVGNETRRSRALTVIVKPAGAVHATRAGNRGAKSLVFDLDDDLAGRLTDGGSNGCVWRQTPPSAQELLTLLPALLRDEAGSAAGDVLETVLRRKTRWRTRARRRVRRSGAPLSCLQATDRPEPADLPTARHDSGLSRGCVRPRQPGPRCGYCLVLRNFGAAARPQGRSR